MVQKKRNIFLDKYTSFNNTLTANNNIIIKINTHSNKNLKNNKNEQFLQQNKKKFKIKNILFNESLPLNNNLNKNFFQENISINNEIGKAQFFDKKQTKMKNGMISYQNKIKDNKINKYNNSNKKLKIDKNISLERSYDIIFENKKRNMSNFKKLLKTYNFNSPNYISKNNNSLSLSRNINYSPTINLNDRTLSINRKNINNNKLKNLANIRKKNVNNLIVNRIKRNIIKKKIKFNKNVEEGSTKQFIKKVQSKEKLRLKKSKKKLSICIYLKDSNSKNLTNSWKNIEIYNTELNKINKIKESPSFKILNAINKKICLRTNNKNIIIKNTNKLYNNEIKIKKRKLRNSLIKKDNKKNKEIIKSRNESVTIKKNVSDYFISLTNNSDLNELKTNSIIQ